MPLLAPKSNTASTAVRVHSLSRSLARRSSLTKFLLAPCLHRDDRVLAWRQSGYASVMIVDRSEPEPPAARGQDLVRIALVATGSGLLTGVVGAAFRLCLERADFLRGTLIAWARHWPLVGWIVPVVVAAVLVATASWMVQRFAPLAAGSGVQHVEAVMRG